MTTPNPLVSILTPVYNGENYLVECIESVLAQTYKNWEYTIVNNCSADGTLEIAQHFANKDKRIRVVTNHHFVEMIENHNIAFQLISQQSKYCKVISADDWIYPECLDRMVALAETHPSVSFVGSYQLAEDRVNQSGLPNKVEVISGRDACRLSLLGNIVFGGPTATLYRSDLIRRNRPFFPHSRPYVDISVHFEHLQFSDFGFVHEILSRERIHSGQESTKVAELGIGTLGCLELLVQYGPTYLSPNELKMVENNLLKNHWRWLGGCLLKLKGAEVWRVQTIKLRELGYPIPWRKVFRGAVDEVLDEMHNPKVALSKLTSALKSKYSTKRKIYFQ